MAKWVALLFAALLCVGESARVRGQPLTAVASPTLHQGSQQIDEPIHREKRGLILGGLVLGGLVGAGAAGVVGAKVFGGSLLAGKALGYGYGRSYGYGGYGGYGYGYGGYDGYGYGGWRSYSGPYYSYYW